MVLNRALRSCGPLRLKPKSFIQYGPVPQEFIPGFECLTSLENLAKSRQSVKPLQNVELPHMADQYKKVADLSLTQIHKLGGQVQTAFQNCGSTYGKNAIQTVARQPAFKQYRADDLLRFRRFAKAWALKDVRSAEAAGLHFATVTLLVVLDEEARRTDNKAAAKGLAAQRTQFVNAFRAGKYDSEEALQRAIVLWRLQNPDFFSQKSNRKRLQYRLKSAPAALDKAAGVLALVAGLLPPKEGAQARALRGKVVEQSAELKKFIKRIR
jgi:hypothetical protein